MTLRFALSVLLLLTATVSFADDRRDGNWWLQQSVLARDAYVLGAFDGTALGYEFSYWKFQGDDASGKCLAKVAESFHEHIDKFLLNVTVKQMVDGLNDFYGDFKNRGILTKGAMWLVANEIAGTPKADLDKMIESWRRNAAKGS